MQLMPNVSRNFWEYENLAISKFY